MKTTTVRDQFGKRDRIQWAMETTVGTLYLVASKNVLHGLHWKEQNIPFADDPSESKVIMQSIEQIGEYLEGKRQSFDIPLDLQGTAFQKQVWNQLKRIPYGETCSYSEIAKNLKNDKAVRAVGSANGKNPISIIVPCHRVIAANGTLAGYAGGLYIKERLLKLEQAKGQKS